MNHQSTFENPSIIWPVWTGHVYSSNDCTKATCLEYTVSTSYISLIRNHKVDFMNIWPWDGWEFFVLSFFCDSSISMLGKKSDVCCLWVFSFNRSNVFAYSHNI